MPELPRVLLSSKNKIFWKHKISSFSNDGKALEKYKESTKYQTQLSPAWIAFLISVGLHPSRSGAYRGRSTCHRDSMAPWEAALAGIKKAAFGTEQHAETGLQVA